MASAISQQEAFQAQDGSPQFGVQGEPVLTFKGDDGEQADRLELV
jgi:hypothetical protein